MSSPLAKAIEDLSSSDHSARLAAAREIYRAGRGAAERAVAAWWGDAELSALVLQPNPVITVGLAVEREIFQKIQSANGSPPLARVPPEQDADEFELDFSGGVLLDILTTREPGGAGAIARYLAKRGQGIQQVEYRCLDVSRATLLLRERLGISSVYPEARPGAGGTRINFFLVASPLAGTVLIELYETSVAHPGSSSTPH
jgi:hypothetical protein